MASQPQIEANRQNAQKSTGPKTPEGKAAVRLNSVKHGLTASTLVLPGEDEAEFESLLDSLEAEHAPATPTEAMIVRQLAMASWRLRRFYHAEAGYYAIRLKNRADDAKKLPEASRIAVVLQYDSQELDQMSRLEARLERSFYKALRELQRLRAQRPAIVPKQTQSEPQPIEPPAPKIDEKRPIPIDHPLLHPDSPEFDPRPPQKPGRQI